MVDSSQEEAAHGDVDHGFGDVDSLFVVADEAAPSGHPTEGSFDDPPSLNDFEARLRIDPSDHFDDEVKEGGLVHQLSAVVSAVGEEMLDPGPSFSQPPEDHLSAGAVGDVGRRQIDHEQAPVSVHRDMAFAPDRLLAGVIATQSAGCGSLDGLTIDDAGGRARLPTGPFTVHHQRDVVNRAKQHQSDKSAEPPVHRLPGRKILRQHPPAAARSRHVADRIQHLAHHHAWSATTLARLWQQRLKTSPFFVGEIGRVALRLPLDRGHSASGFACPHA